MACAVVIDAGVRHALLLVLQLLVSCEAEPNGWNVWDGWHPCRGSACNPNKREESPQCPVTPRCMSLIATASPVVLSRHSCTKLREPFPKVLMGSQRGCPAKGSAHDIAAMVGSARSAAHGAHAITQY